MMGAEMKTEGKYELFKSIDGKKILNLDNQAYYQFGEDQNTGFMAYSEPDPPKDSAISTGRYFFAGKGDDSSSNGPFTLFLEDGDAYKEFELPEGLPLQRNEPQKKLEATNKKLSKDDVMQRVKK